MERQKSSEGLNRSRGIGAGDQAQIVGTLSRGLVLAAIFGVLLVLLQDVIIVHRDNR